MVMVDEFDIIAIVGIVTSYLIIKKIIEVSRDVNEVYLNEQSHIEATRLENESAIHKSNKLDYSHGLRVGLDIRYDHYKLRNGNLADIWEVAMNFLKKNDKQISIGDTSCTFLELNYVVDLIGKYLVEEKVNVVGMNSSLFLDSKYSFAVMLSCFVNQITVNLYDDIDNTDDVDLYIIREYEVESVERMKSKHIVLDKNSSIPDIFKFTGKLAEFHNVYTLQKDRGVALRLTKKISPKIISNVDFIQMNLVSALAATLRHLPEEHAISSEDKLLIVPTSNNNEEILNELNKILIALITNSDLVISKTFSEKVLNEIKPTVLSISEEKFYETLPILKLKQRFSTIEQVKYFIKLKLLAQGILSSISVKNSPVRIIYLNKTIEKGTTLFNSVLNQYRAIYNSRIVFERGYYCVAGAIIQNDFYDYRSFSVDNHLKGFGCLSQSIEAKISDYNKKTGNLEIRGYNIGKIHNRLIGKEGDFIEQAIKNRQKDGFMSIKIKCKWGSDGCLYVL